MKYLVAKLVLLFILIPALELWLLIEIGRQIGALATIGLIVLTGILGASLARWQGFAVLAEIQREMGQGRIPATSLLDGLLILIAGAVLLTPGLLTDVAGFLILIPFTRRVLRDFLIRWVKQRVEEGAVQISFMGRRYEPSSSDVIDVTPERSTYSDEVEKKRLP